MAIGLSWHGVPLFAAGMALVALALWLLVLDRRDRLHVAFAAFLLVRGFGNVGTALITSEQTDAAGAVLVAPWLMGAWLLVPLAAAWFVVELRRRHGDAGSWPHATKLLVGLLVVLVASIVFAPGLYMELPEDPHGAGLDILVTTDFRLYGLLFGVVQFTYGLLALVLASDAIAQPSDPRRRSLLLVLTGLVVLPATFAVVGAFETLLLLLGTIDRAIVSPDFGAAFYLPKLAFFVLASVATVIALARVARRSPGNAVTLREARRVVTVPALFLIAATVLFVLGPVGLDLAGAFGLFNALDGIATLTLPLLATYALVRYQLFGVQAKVKFAIKGSTVAAAFLAIFFIVSESAATFFSGQIGTYVGIAAAGLLVFALAPLQRFAERVADTAMPGVKPVAAMDDEERTAAYAEVVEVAWSDGNLTRSERAMLAKVRDKLGLTVEEAARIEERVAGT